MRTDIPAALQSHLDTRETTLAWCWKITRRDAVVLGFTNHDRPLIFDSVTYEASTGFLGTEVESQLGMSVDNMDVFGAIDSTNITESDISAGRYDNAVIEIFLVNWEDVTERVIMKKGNLGEVKRGQTMFQTEVRGISHQLQNVKGRIYGYTCDALVGLEDGRCNKDLSGATFTGTAAVISTNGKSTTVVSGLTAYEAGWFTRGKVTFTSGLNNGISREVQLHNNSNGTVSINLWDPTPFLIAVTDTFTVTAGCDKLWKTCKAKFSNQNNFRGFPHIPGPNALSSYANTGDPKLDGKGNFRGKD